MDKKSVFSCGRLLTKITIDLKDYILLYLNFHENKAKMK